MRGPSITTVPLIAASAITRLAKPTDNVSPIAYTALPARFHLRRLRSIKIAVSEERLTFEVKADAFCHQMVRSLVLFAAHAAGVLAIETVYPNIADTDAIISSAVMPAVLSGS